MPATTSCKPSTSKNCILKALDTLEEAQNAAVLSCRPNTKDPVLFAAARIPDELQGKRSGRWSACGIAEAACREFALP